MKKEKKVVYGIEIVKPWSQEMYDHNEQIAEVVREKVLGMWNEAMAEFQDQYAESFMSDIEWHANTYESLRNIQLAVTVYAFGYGYDVAAVETIVLQELEDAPFYRLVDIVDDLDIELEKGFVGFN
jgi:hypothetical protein